MRVRQHQQHEPARRLHRSQLTVGIGAAALFFAAILGGARSAEPDGRNLTAQVQQPLVPLPSLAPLVDRVLPAVVNISAELRAEAAVLPDRSAQEGNGQSSPFEEMLRRFFENHGLPQIPGRKVTALGSGFLIDPGGYIVTNNHVVGKAEKITVILQDNGRHPAKLIGRDEKTDLALLKIEAKEKLPYLAWGDSDKAKVGDWVVAVGNPFGLGGTVTAGIVSALGRNIDEGPYDDFIQIDAPINRGNSGGPTFDLSGSVIGINTAIYSPSGGSVGIGFAIPSNTARNVVQQLEQHGKVTRGWLGVTIQGITPAIAASLGLDPNAPQGALVTSVSPNSPAAKAGIKQGDAIVSANGHPIKSTHDLPRLVAPAPIGQKFPLVIRRNGRDVTIEATVAEMPDNQPAAGPSKGEPKLGSLGLELSPLNSALRRQYHVPKEVEGVVVTNVAKESPFAPLGLQPGDVIVSVDQHPVKTPTEAGKELQQAVTKGNVLLLLNRRGTNEFVGLTISPGTVHPG